ncbi:endopeptidase La [Chloroflexia bacterium SDU3-3]|nr:endopeptidase La [Chloroflexia bacterium SDU3-3]
MPNEPPILFDFPQNPDAAFSQGQGGESDLPVLPLINTVLFPHMLSPLFVGREPSMQAVEEAMAADRRIVAVSQREQDVDEVGPADLFTIGVEALVQRMLKMPDGSTSVVVQGQRRVRIRSFEDGGTCLHARVEPIFSEEERTLAVEAMMRAVLSLFERVVKLSRTLPDDSYVMAMNVDDPGWLADLIASTMPLDVPRRQEILETLDPEERLRRLSVMLTQELDVLELESRIHTQVQKEVDRNQRELFLREQMKAIQRELGQEDPLTHEIGELRTRVMIELMPENIREKAMEEIDRMEAMSPASPEYGIVRTYIDWLLDLPWMNLTDDRYDLEEAAHVLDLNHHGLDSVKERILEFMAVRQLAGEKQKSPILCFVGPPGVGKTSLGRSIAEALERTFVRASLGGVHDEAEIRGHRRTYIGAMPGRVIKAMKEAETSNPVFMLDEIDKLGANFRGDPAAALLEVLDPEQNTTFRDHYLDVPFDLSKVLFIATANLLDPIPAALLDRMEVITLSGYTEQEKLVIAQRFLVPKQIEANGLEAMGVQFTDSALRQIIRHYTYEAGVRNLEREIGAVCRKIARRVAEMRSFPHRVQGQHISQFLGPARYSHGLAEREDGVGVATGMTWTAKGGDVMAIEVSVMEGKGALLLTGHLGDVMRESAQAALTYARANAQRLGLDSRQFDRLDIHVHVPEGAIPKEGPSAGIGLATALISALSGRKVRREVAMTGEITLRGRVLPIGGLKEKVLGAHRAGIRTVVVPAKNKRDLIDVPTSVKRQLRFVYVEQMDEVLEAALLP